MMMVMAAERMEFVPLQLHQSAEKSQKTPPLQLQHQSPASSPITPFPFTLPWACPSGPIFCHDHYSLTKASLGERGISGESRTSGFTRKWPFLHASPGIQLSHL